mgnify:CR=1 FL=1
MVNKGEKHPVKDNKIALEEEKGLKGRIHYLHLPMQEDADGKGADYHPSAITHEKTQFLVEKKIKEIKEQKEENPLGIDHSPIKLDKAKHDSVNIAPREEIIVTHNVSTGETLKSIAEKYNCTPEDIARWNNIRLHNEILKPGRKIIIKPEEETGKIKAEKEKAEKEEFLDKLKEIIADIKYGSVNLIIQDGKVIQIDKIEKIRL